VTFTPTLAELIGLAAIATAVACLAMAVLVVGVKTERALRERAAQRRLARLRPLVILVATGEDTEDGDALRELAGVTGAARRDLRDLVVQVLGKVRGEPADQLVELLREHGLLHDAARQTRNPLPSRRVRGLYLIGCCRDVGSLDVAVRALEDRSSRVRRQAVRTVGQIGDPQAARPLLRSLRREGVHLGDAAEALVGMGYGISDSLHWALEHGHPRARTVAAHLCGIGGVRSAAPLLVTQLESHDDPTVAAVAATALGKVGRVQDAGALSAAALHFFPFQVRHAAIEALGELGVEAAVPVLVRHLTDPRSQIAEAAARSLISLGPSGRRAVVDHELLPAAGTALALARLRGVPV
jgi:HEAT repeats